LVLPAYNEVECLETAVEWATRALDEFVPSFEILIAEDGSTDGTAELAHELTLRYSNLRHIHVEKRLGRGAALRNAFNQCNGKVFVYMDLDLSTHMRCLKPLVEAITIEGYDFCVASRNLPKSKVERTWRRGIASKIYNLIVRTVLGSKILDHQCGFKAFRREAVVNIVREVRANHWFWDTEILVRAARRGYRIKEIPVEWRGGRSTKVHLVRDSFRMGRQVFSLRWQLRRRPFAKKS
jgi:glycosyltransferase involved in cell wall biosynthesis